MQETFATDPSLLQVASSFVWLNAMILSLFLLLCIPTWLNMNNWTWLISLKGKFIYAWLLKNIIKLYFTENEFKDNKYTMGESNPFLELLNTCLWINTTFLQLLVVFPCFLLLLTRGELYTDFWDICILSPSVFSFQRYFCLHLNSSSLSQWTKCVHIERWHYG